MYKCLASLLSSLLVFAAHGTASAVILNLDARSSDPVLVSLGAGTYTIRFIGVADGGLYTAYNAWNDGPGTDCDTSGGHCATGWLDTFTIDDGTGPNTFYKAGSNLPSTGINVYADADLALVQFQSGPIYQTRDYQPLPGLINFTLASPGVVRFSIDDQPKGDNAGGVSLLLDQSPVPEASTWVMMLIGMFVTGRSFRSRASDRAQAA